LRVRDPDITARSNVSAGAIRCRDFAFLSGASRDSAAEHEARASDRTRESSSSASAHP